MLQYSKSAFAPIDEDIVIGSFAEEAKGKSVMVGSRTTKRGFKQYYASLSHVDESGTTVFSPLLNAAKKVAQALNNQLEGVTDGAERNGIVLKAFNECSILEVPDYELNADGTVSTTQKKNDDGTPATRHILAAKGNGRLTEQEANASIAKVASGYSITSAMKFRV